MIVLNLTLSFKKMFLLFIARNKKNYSQNFQLLKRKKGKKRCTKMEEKKEEKEDL